ncbi:DUF924 family protein [Roseateles terrae]|uniref:Uncharacterized protein (DUF924 family)/predicted GNAT family acetyltransferase n=1 Tax=Roseateles terrae TaxID=431060 RepID=A0ABR6GPY0_9BURK|nr:DUF924 family protein [Roseateles terrae]MBB3194165.1 uncharacterized protein (DUF924 family)/predicted GNAT family acetyltransferase [Roseateles terrae]OWQ88019.1 hypothetical protein CDN98_07690 [Roseateles terrae]
MNVVIQHHPDHRCFLAHPQPGVQCRLDYERHGEQLIITHTGVPAQLRGQGVAAQLVETAARWLASQTLQLVPGCTYVRHWLAHQPRWQRLTAPAAAQRVLNEWFGLPGGAEDGQVQTKWFKKDPAFDAALRERFGSMVDAALAGEHQAWDRNPWGALARILLLDQFTRNIYRETPQSFAGDDLALQAALALLPQLPVMSPLERWFALMPLEHAESLEMQERCVAAFEALAAEDERLVSALDYARKHRDVIQRFGRFPHRNAVLGRVSTPEEEAFLQQPGSRF